MNYGNKNTFFLSIKLMPELERPECAIQSPPSPPIRVSENVMSKSVAAGCCQKYWKLKL